MTDLGLKLSKADSNHHKQNQNLLCYHYTIGQSRVQRYAFFAPAQNFMVLFLYVLRSVQKRKVVYRQPWNGLLVCNGIISVL